MSIFYGIQTVCIRYYSAFSAFFRKNKFGILNLIFLLCRANQYGTAKFYRFFRRENGDWSANAV